jgi:hypothetical protein
MTVSDCGSKNCTSTLPLLRRAYSSSTLRMSRRRTCSERGSVSSRVK